MRNYTPIAVAVVTTLFFSTAAYSQAVPPPPPAPPRAQQNNPVSAAPANPANDPGVRSGADAGGPIAGLNSEELKFFAAAFEVFKDINSVSGTIAGEADPGLGPRFNHNSCAGCHAYPSTGGTSPPQNPQIAVATLHGARNTVPSFIRPNGPVRVARFVRNADGTPDGGVHDLFVISGRSDAPGCQITQPDFATEQAANNVIFRIPTPLFGLGLVEATPDANLTSAFAANAALKAQLGVSGHFNHSGNDGTITRFGWKAQNKSLLIFTGEAYNVEQGVTNELYPNEREPACPFNAMPEDGTTLDTIANVTSPASAHASDSLNIATMMKLMAPPAVVPTAAAQRGEKVFSDLGCQTCHVATQTTGRSTTAALSNVTYHPYSDFALHDMGRGLNDRITQGEANGADWRTAPLWGLGQRLFFLHDGRTNDLVAAITAHASQGSEANGVITRFNALARDQMADLLAFLRAL
ncbi:MAG: di-heme oxidoredictase family protein [Rhodospirillaceae bacterium]